MRTKRGRTHKTEAMKRYRITYEDISGWFGYSSPQSFNSSKAKRDMIEGIDSVIKRVEETIKK